MYRMRSPGGGVGRGGEKVQNGGEGQDGLTLNQIGSEGLTLNHFGRWFNHTTIGSDFGDPRVPYLLRVRGALLASLVV
jgi:hypothetical protein